MVADTGAALDDLGDGDLAVLAMAGRQAAYRVLLDRHRALVFRIARNHCGDDDAALDITQQSFVSAFAALARYDRARPFPHWLARITLNKCHDHARRRRVRDFFTFARPLDEAAGIAAPQVPADTQLADAQDLRRAMAAIARLPDRLKEVLVLRTLESMSQNAVADLLGISGKAVETRLYRAREKLAELLRD